VNSWPSGCGAEGPRGLALDRVRRLLFVACTDGAVAFDLAHEGRSTGRLKTGAGVDTLEYDAEHQRLFVASSKDATLTIAHAADGGTLEVQAVVPTAKGARNPVIDARGMLYVEDSADGRLLIIDVGREAAAAKKAAATSH